MKITLAQQNYTVGDFAENLKKIRAALQQARSDQSDVLLFPELSVGGYPPKDLLVNPSFLKSCRDTIEQIKSAAEDTAVIIGAPYPTDGVAESKPENAAVFIHKGKVSLIGKTLLSPSPLFPDVRYFQPSGRNEKTITFNGKKIGILIGDEYQKELLKEADYLFVLAASPYDPLQKENRLERLSFLAQKHRASVFFCNTVGAQTDLIFDGNSFGLNEKGELIFELPAFRETVETIDTTKASVQKKRIPVIKKEQYDPKHDIGQIHEALILGVRDYFKKQDFKKAVMGSSGGIDSAVGIALACEALGKEQVLSVLMPSDFSSTHSVTDAKQLAENIGCPYEVIPIKEVYGAFLKTLSPVFKDLPFDVTEENLQARSRGAILMALANKFGSLLLNNTNKSELAVGYGTLYGDMTGSLAILGDLYKTEVYALAEYINKEKEIIPQNIIDKAPSAELRPEQKDSDSLPDYKLMDAILYQYIEGGASKEEIIRMDFDPKLTERIIGMVNRSAYKRKQFCPILKVSSKSFDEMDFPLI